MKLLLVEDERELANSVCSYLMSEGMRCECVFDFNTALERIELYEYDCLIIDLTLPGGNGLDLVQRTKVKNTNTGIIIISAKGGIQDKLRGLELGSDDYLTKPFYLSELNARIKALMRRRNFNGSKDRVIGDVAIDLNALTVTVCGKALSLTRTEFDLLLYLTSNRDKVLAKEAIAEHLLGNQADQSDSFDFIYSHIKNLRKKIVDLGGKDPIKTIYGLGYKYVSGEPA